MKNKKLAIVAVGGNSLVKDEKRKSSRHQYMIVKETAHHIADMIEAGWDMAIGHGNGPQLGFALHVPPGTFTCQSQFSGGALLLVLCSNTYDVADYIEAEEFFAGSHYSSVPEAMGARADG